MPSTEHLVKLNDAYIIGTFLQVVLLPIVAAFSFWDFKGMPWDGTHVWVFFSSLLSITILFSLLVTQYIPRYHHLFHARWAKHLIVYMGAINLLNYGILLHLFLTNHMTIAEHQNLLEDFLIPGYRDWRTTTYTRNVTVAFSLGILTMVFSLINCCLFCAAFRRHEKAGRPMSVVYNVRDVLQNTDPNDITTSTMTRDEWVQKQERMLEKGGYSTVKKRKRTSHQSAGWYGGDNNDDASICMSGAAGGRPHDAPPVEEDGCELQDLPPAKTRNRRSEEDGDKTLRRHFDMEEDKSLRTWRDV